VAEALADHGATGYGGGRLDRLLARNRVFSGLSGAGVRNVLRQKRRSAAIVAQVAVAVALALALLAGGVWVLSRSRLLVGEDDRNPVDEPGDTPAMRGPSTDPCGGA
jgi:hypothetical protein